MKLTDFFRPGMVELIRAIEKGDEARARKYLKGVSLNMHGDEGITPLFWLMTHKDKAGMRLAIELGADPNFADPNGDSPVIFAAGANDDELLLILLEGGGDANAVDSDGHPTIFAAVAEERKGQIDMLIRFGADINLTDRSGRNSALYGSYINRYEMVHYLIEKGADHAVRSATRADIAWQIHDGLSKNLLSPEYPAYDWALKVKQQLIDRGVKFPPPSPLDVRWSEGNPDKYDIRTRRKELQEKLENTSEKGLREALERELEAVKQLEENLE
ncbi:MAG TPA: ankyrin repeat domain-containing protein [Gammaproteobacteria bacterium]|nr:ankyrin repeat domain-containing protein [Gammaproteobacteria bacterium]